jgi:hypothetical protein
MNKPGWENYQTTVYEDDLIWRGPPPQYRSILVGFKGVTVRLPANPGKRPRRKPGESPLDPPSE